MGKIYQLLVDHKKKLELTICNAQYVCSLYDRISIIKIGIKRLKLSADKIESKFNKTNHLTNLIIKTNKILIRKTSLFGV